ncbi:MAG TPA: TOMM precursor leader peptide-binding protein [Mycobacteriales bacterium]|jgi:bacteriocin biosynthesis cyclodehydratase domain-containing protein|nr:TOMM precursor leader peptide-binding protein [Mycobacteriales bacterium]
MSDLLPSRPLLNRALRRVWRDHETLQLGLEPRHAVVLRGLTRADERLLDLLDGTRGVEAIVEAATALGVDELSTRRLLQTLMRARALDDGLSQPRGNERERQRLAPDALTLALLDRRPGVAAQALLGREAATVAVHGVGRIGSTIVGLLAAAGVGRVVCVDPRAVAAADLSPAGAAEPTAETRAGDAVRRAEERYGADRVVARSAATPTLAIVAPVGSTPGPEVMAEVRDLPHLLVHVRETSAFVGPLVLPGESTCWRCVQIARSDRDPAWPAITAQLTGVAQSVEPADVALASLAASLAVTHALAWLDRETLMRASQVPSIDGIVEFDLADLRLRRRTLRAHPDCGCGAADAQAPSLVSSTQDRTA